MRIKNITLFHVFILLSLLVWNGWIYMHRNEGYAYKEFLSYNSLYYPSQKPILKSLKLIHADSARIQLSNLKETKDAHLNYDIHLKEGREHYFISFDNDTLNKIEFGIDYASNKTFKENGNDRPAALELYYSSIPTGTFKTYGIHDWQYSSPDEKADLIETKKLILENIGLLKTETDLEKIQKIGAYLLKSLDKARGLPLDSMDHFNGLKRFKYAVSTKSKIWCGDFAGILAMFLNSEGINSRLVCTEGELGDLKLGGHSMNEVYVKELNKWILVDLTSRAIFIKHQGIFLNTIELYEMHRNDVLNLNVTTLVGDSLEATDYTNLKEFYSNYFTNSTQIVYYFNTQFDPHSFTFWQKWKRYFFPSPTFATYSGTIDSNNFNFNVKQTAFIALILYVIYCLVFVVLKRH